MQSSKPMSRNSTQTERSTASNSRKTLATKAKRDRRRQFTLPRGTYAAVARRLGLHPKQVWERVNRSRSPEVMEAVAAYITETTTRRAAAEEVLRNACR